MPYKSEKQRRFMYSQEPAIAKKWDREGKNYISRSSRKNTRSSGKRH